MPSEQSLITYVITTTDLILGVIRIEDNPYELIVNEVFPAVDPTVSLADIKEWYSNGRSEYIALGKHKYTSSRHDVVYLSKNKSLCRIVQQTIDYCREYPDILK